MRLGLLPVQSGRCDIVLEEDVGPVAVIIDLSGGRPSFAQLAAARLPEYRPAPAPADRIAAMLSLGPRDMLDGPLVPMAISCGVPFLFVPLRDRPTVGRARIDHAVWQALFALTWAPHVYVYSLDAELPGSHVRARMFAPAMGIPEDPATGGAATPLAGYLARQDAAADATLRWNAEAEKQRGEVVAVRVGGRAVLVGEGTLVTP